MVYVQDRSGFAVRISRTSSRSQGSVSVRLELEVNTKGHRGLSNILAFGTASHSMIPRACPQHVINEALYVPCFPNLLKATLRHLMLNLNMYLRSIKRKYVSILRC